MLLKLRGRQWCNTGWGCSNSVCECEVSVCRVEMSKVQLKQRVRWPQHVDKPTPDTCTPHPISYVNGYVIPRKSNDDRLTSSWRHSVTFRTRPNMQRFRRHFQGVLTKTSPRWLFIDPDQPHTGQIYGVERTSWWPCSVNDVQMSPYSAVIWPISKCCWNVRIILKHPEREKSAKSNFSFCYHYPIKAICNRLRDHK